MQSRCSRWKWNGNRRNCSVVHINGESIWSEDVSLFVMSSFAFYSNNYLLIAIVFFAPANVCVCAHTDERLWNTVQRGKHHRSLYNCNWLKWGSDCQRNERFKMNYRQAQYTWTHKPTRRFSIRFDSIRLLLLLLLAALIPIHSHRFVYVCDHDAKCKFTSMLCASCIFRMQNCMFALCFSLAFIFIC